MELGAFSVSLSVKDIRASRDFYSKLGFSAVGGDVDENWLILRNGEHVIGLFQGMFERNMLTFNPGWDQQGNDSDRFQDVREIQQQLRDLGVSLLDETDKDGSGPGSILIQDPDENPILIDQHRT